MLWKTFEAMREEVMGDWWRLHNKELHDLYSSPNIIRVIRSITIRWEKHMIYIYIYVYKKGVTRQAEVAQGVPGSLRPRIFLTFRHYKDGRSSAKSTDRLYPRRNPWYSLSETESGVPRKKSPVTPPGIDLGTVRHSLCTTNNFSCSSIPFFILPLFVFTLFLLSSPSSVFSSSCSFIRVPLHFSLPFFLLLTPGKTAAALPRATLCQWENCLVYLVRGLLGSNLRFGLQHL